jgi:SAM-dependent methyltransferase
VVGLDLSPDMVATARDRVARAGWTNVQVIEGAAEDASLPGPFDALLLFAMHDVLTSPAGLDHCLAALRAGARVVSAGPWVPDHGPARLLRPVLRLVFRTFALSSQDTGQPWRLLALRVPVLQVLTHGPMYVAWGSVT